MSNPAIIESKAQEVSVIATKLKEAVSVVIVEYHGLTVQEMTTLRRALRAKGIEFKIYKNTLVDLAAKQVGYEDLSEHLVGPNAIAFSNEQTDSSNVLVDFIKKHPAMKLKVGIVDGKLVDPETINVLAGLPDKNGMLSMLLGCLQAPIRNFAYAIKSIAEKENN